MQLVVAGMRSLWWPWVGTDYDDRYALERTSHEIKAWFWARNDPNVPKDVQTDYHHSRGLLQAPILGSLDPQGHHPDTLVIDTSKWGVPDVRFVNDQCNIPAHFKRQKIIINLTFCTFPPPHLYRELTMPRR
jgi:hypothetical protein